MAFVHDDIGQREFAAAVEIFKLEMVVAARLERVNLNIGESLSIYGTATRALSLHRAL
jgi:hypothetical protein